MALPAILYNVLPMLAAWLIAAAQAHAQPMPPSASARAAADSLLQPPECV